MNENQIDYFIQHNLREMRKRDFKKYYRGSFACDELTHSSLKIRYIDKPQCFGFIFNTLERRESAKMGHWLAIVVKIMAKSINLKFFDSFNKPYTFYGICVSNYINKLRVRALSNKSTFKLETAPFSLQAIDSKICGGYTIYSILRLKKCNHTTLKQIYDSFDRKKMKKNDSKIMKYIAENWPRKVCSDMITSSDGISFCPVKTYDHNKCLSKCLCDGGCCNKHRSLEYIRANLTKILI